MTWVRFFGGMAVVWLGFLSNCLEYDKSAFLEIADVVFKLSFRGITHQQVKTERRRTGQFQLLDNCHKSIKRLPALVLPIENPET
ncbi:MAG: hypothetical protein ACM3SR_05600 [Ignavibacteriales bacterium]